MIYDKPAGTRIYRPLRGRPGQPPKTPVSDADRETIRRVAENHPDRGPRQVLAELRLAGRDMPLASVETVIREAS